MANVGLFDVDLRTVHKTNDWTKPHRSEHGWTKINPLCSSHLRKVLYWLDPVVQPSGETSHMAEPSIQTQEIDLHCLQS